MFHIQAQPPTLQRVRTNSVAFQGMLPKIAQFLFKQWNEIFGPNSHMHHKLINRK